MYRSALFTAVAIATSVSAGAAAPATAVAVAPTSASPASSATHSRALQQRAEELIELINGHGDPAQMFAPKVLAQVPGSRLKAIAAALRDKYGAAVGVDRIEATAPNRGRVFINFERTQLSLKLGVEPSAPNLIVELLFG